MALSYHAMRASRHFESLSERTSAPSFNPRALMSALTHACTHAWGAHTRRLGTHARRQARAGKRVQAL
eukprot:6173181-Pleurochrysis_carterae.AAC.2